MPQNVVSGLAYGDTVDLTAVQFDSGATATVIAGNRLQVSANGNTYTLNLDPANDYSSVKFGLTADGTGGTAIVFLTPPTAPSVIGFARTAAHGQSFAASVLFTAN